MLLALFVYFPFWIVSVVDRQQADTKSNCTHCIRRGLGRRLRSSLLLNSSPSTSRDTSLSQLVLVEIHQSLPTSLHSDTHVGVGVEGKWMEPEVGGEEGRAHTMTSWCNKLCKKKRCPSQESNPKPL